MGAGAVWGLVFVAPEFVSDFSPLQLTIGRYLLYGLIAAALIIPRWHFLASQLPQKQWRKLIWLAFTGNTLYYVLLSTAVHAGGVAMTSLVIGFLPVVVTLVGSRDQGALPLRRLAPSLLLCAAGAVCIGWQALSAPNEETVSTQLLGLVCAIGALASWTAYTIGNARSLARLDHISSHDWSLLIGIVTGAQSVLLIPFAIAFDTAHHFASDWLRLAAVSTGVAILASIVGNALWNRMSRLLPLTLIGQMILFETIFALMYGLLWEQRLPTNLEISALSFVILSVVSCVKAHRTKLVVEPVA